MSDNEIGVRSTADRNNHVTEGSRDCGGQFVAGSLERTVFTTESTEVTENAKPELDSASTFMSWQ